MCVVVTPWTAHVATSDDDRAGRPLPFPGSLCHGCRHLRVVESKRGSIFLSCTEPSLPKYLPQPVVRCAVRAPIDRRGGA